MVHDPQLPRAFCDLLRAFRLRADLTQAELAERAGVSTRAVSDLELGKNQYPRADTTDLLARGLNLSGSDEAAFRSAARPPAAARNRGRRKPAPAALPFQPSPLFGRHQEVCEISAHLTRPGIRLLTLTGPGGVGKTRLALEVAASKASTFRDGARFVDLSSLAGPADVIPTLLHALAPWELMASDPWHALSEHLAPRQELLVLDTFELVIAAARDLADLLSVCGDIKILVTSREPLHLRAEHRFPVPPLPVHALSPYAPLSALSDAPAVALFIDRAQAIDHQFALTTDTAPAVVAICQHLDGLPLALELAAARVDALPVTLIAQEIARHAEPSGSGYRDLPARQATVTSTLAWSVQFLTPQEQTLLTTLAVFNGSAPLEAILVVNRTQAAHEDNDASRLERLTVLHLAHREELADGSRRYRLPDVVHEYVLNQVPNEEEDDRRRAHASHYLALATSAQEHLDGPHRRRWLDRLETDLPNLRGALSWLISTSDGASALQLASALWEFWEARGYVTEGRSWLEQSLTAGANVASDVRADALLAVAGLAEAQGDFAVARAHLASAVDLLTESEDQAGLARARNNLALVCEAQGEYTQAAELYGDVLRFRREQGAPQPLAVALNNLGNLEFSWGNYSQARDLHEEALALRRGIHDERGIAASLVNLATATSALDDEDGAYALLTEALDAYRALADPGGIAAALLNLGTLDVRSGDLAQARTRYEAALELQGALKDQNMTAMLLGNLAEVALLQGDVDEALRRDGESLRLRQHLGDKVGVGLSLIGLAGVAQVKRECELAASLTGTAEAIFNYVGYRMHPVERAQVNELRDVLREQIGEARFLVAQERGRITAVDVAARNALATLEGMNRGNR